MTEKLMTVEEVAEMLGLTRTAIYQMVYYRRIEGVIKISRKCLRFDPVAIRKWLAEKSQAAVPRQHITAGGNYRPTDAKRGRPRKNSASDSYINSLVEQAKKEVIG